MRKLLTVALLLSSLSVATLAGDTPIMGGGDPPCTQNCTSAQPATDDLSLLELFLAGIAGAILP